MERSEKINMLRRIIEGKVLKRPHPLFQSLTITQSPEQLPTYSKDGIVIDQQEYERCIKNYEARKPYNTHSYERKEANGTVITEFIQFKDPVNFDLDQLKEEPVYRMPDGSLLVF